MSSESSPTKNSSPDALLLVFVQPSPSLPLEEFHSWSEEHVALRTPLEGFRSAIRLEAVDGVKPDWGGIYDIESMEVLDSPEYKNLNINRSEREKNVMAKLTHFDRRIYKRIGRCWPSHDVDGQESPGGTPAKQPALPKLFILVSMTPKPDMEAEFHQWYEEEHIEMLSRVPGWVRSRRFGLVERTGTGSERPPKFLAMHEYEDEGCMKSGEWKAATSTPWRNRIMDVGIDAIERRVFKVLRNFK